MHFPPAAEPVPVAQGDGYFILRFFRDLTEEQRRFLLVGLGAMPDAPSEPFTHAIQRRILDRLLATIADHAHREAEWAERELVALEAHRMACDETVAAERKIAALEASLAACQAELSLLNDERDYWIGG
jgi:hypothetical protein